MTREQPTARGDELLATLAARRDPHRKLALMYDEAAGQREQLEATAVMAGPVAAPVAAGQEIGTLIITIPGNSPIERPLLAGADVPELGLMGRVMAALKRMVMGDDTAAPEEPAAEEAPQS